MTLDSPKSILEFLEISPAKIMKKATLSIIEY